MGVRRCGRTYSPASFIARRPSWKTFLTVAPKLHHVAMPATAMSMSRRAYSIVVTALSSFQKADKVGTARARKARRAQAGRACELTHVSWLHLE